MLAEKQIIFKTRHLSQQILETTTLMDKVDKPDKWCLSFFLP